MCLENASPPLRFQRGRAEADMVIALEENPGGAAQPAGRRLLAEESDGGAEGARPGRDPGGVRPLLAKRHAPMRTGSIDALTLGADGVRAGHRN